MTERWGGKHPKYGFVYPVNYGYVLDTLSPDGEELDAYLLLVDEPVESFKGRVIAVIQRIDDDDDKLIVIPEEKEITDEQIENAVKFQEQWFKHKLIR